MHERMSHGKGVKGPKEKERVPGWSIEEMKEKPNVAVVEDTEEMRKWRGMSQDGMNQCWKMLADRMEEEVLDKYNFEESNREAFGGRGAVEWRRVRKNKKYRIREWGEDCWARTSLCSENTTFSVCNASRWSQRKKKKR